MGASSEPGPLLTNVAPADDAITFAEQMMQLLEEASFSTTYKHALLLALMDACLELADGTGLAPSVLEMTDLAERVIALYWPHVVPYPPTRRPRRLPARLHNGVPLWVTGRTFQPADADLLHQALAA